MKTTEVVTAVVLHEGKILFLRRSQDVGSYRGMWSCVSGHMEPSDTGPEERAVRELEEETGIAAEDILRLTYAGRQTVTDRAAGREWIVHIVLCEMRPEWDGRVELDWENTAYVWSSDVPEDSVPGLPETVKVALAARGGTPSK